MCFAGMLADWREEVLLSVVATWGGRADGHWEAVLAAMEAAEAARIEAERAAFRAAQEAETQARRLAEALGSG